MEIVNQGAEEKRPAAEEQAQHHRKRGIKRSHDELTELEKYTELVKASSADTWAELRQYDECIKLKLTSALDYAGNEVVRWSGDREETAKELKLRFDALQKEYEQEKSERVAALIRNSKLNTENQQLKEALKVKVRDLEGKHLLEIHTLKNQHAQEIQRMRENEALQKEEFLGEIESWKQKIRNLELKLEDEGNDKENLRQKIAGDVAKEQAVGLQEIERIEKEKAILQTEKVELVERLKISKEEVTHFNNEAARLSKILKKQTKVIKKHHIDYDNEMDGVSLGNMTVTPLSGQARNIEINKSIEELTHQLDLYAYLTGTKSKAKEDGVYFKCVNPETRMVEFRFEKISDTTVTYDPTREVPDELLPDSMRSKREMPCREFPHFFTQIMHLVHGDSSNEKEQMYNPSRRDDGHTI